MTSSFNDSISRQRLRAGAIVALTIVAPLLGGSVELWAQGILAVGAGSLMVIVPPQRSLGKIPNLLFFVVFLVALSAFLPADWFASPVWRIELLKLGARLPATRSPQPWLTLQWAIFLLLVLAWSYYLGASGWTRRHRISACDAFAIAILFLSAMLTIGFVTKLHVPFWPKVAQFGFFPNRNQTSDVLGLGAVMIYGLGLQRFQEGIKWWWIWFASLSLVCWALIIDGSRAGVVLFFLGALTVHIYWWSTTPDRRQTLVAFGGLVLLIALFLVDGGATAMRFTKETAGFFTVGENLRFAIYRDAVHLIAKSSPLGIGLGNFWPIFALNRRYSANISQTAHPESDWLWAAIDVGWIGALIGIALFLWWLSQCLPFAQGTNRLLRVTAMICGIAFSLHGFLDVSGHRLGALWPALFFASIAINPERRYAASGAIGFFFRIVGAILCAAGVWWIASLNFKTPPTTATVERFRNQLDRAITSENNADAVTVSTEALAIAPLDWNLYFKRGAAEAAVYAPRESVLRDFVIARYLLPNWPDLYFKEGMVWVGLGETDLAFETWADGIRRLPQSATGLYSDIFDVIKSDAELRERWRQLADENEQQTMVFLSAADGTEFQLELQQLLVVDDRLRQFSQPDLKRLFSLWYQKGDKLWLADTLQSHPEWKKLAWPQLARTYADYQDYRQAFETASSFLEPPDPVASAGSTTDLARQFQQNPDDPNTGLALARALASEGKLDKALSLVLVVRKLPGSPKKAAVIEARLWAQKKEWRRAWQAIEPLVPAQ